MGNQEDLNKLKQMFCPPMEFSQVEKIYYNSKDLDEAINDLLCYACIEENHSSGEASLPELGKSDCGDSSSLGSYVSNDQSPLDFMKSCFPDAPLDTLRTILMECNEDIQKAFENYLSEEFIINNGGYTIYELGRLASDIKKEELEELEWKYTPAKAKNTKNKVSKANQLIKLDFNSIEKWTDSHWLELEKRCNSLIDLYSSINPLEILYLFYQYNGNSSKVLMNLNKIEKVRKPIFKDDNLEEDVDKLILLFPKISWHKLAACRIKFNTLDLAMDKLLNSKLDSNVSANNKINGNRSKNKSISFNLSTKSYSSSIANQSKSQISPFGKLNYKHIAKSLISSDEYSLLEHVKNLRQKKFRLYHQAAMAFSSRRSPGKQGIPSYYSSQAREIDSQIQNICYWSSKAMFENDQYTLDLHGFTVAESTSLIQGILEMWWVREKTKIEMKQNRKPFEVITGAGFHSEDGQSKLKPHVIAIVKGLGWRYMVKDAHVIIYGPVEWGM